MTSADGRAEGRVDAARIVKALRACPVVANMSGGRFGEIATYLPGERVPGVRLSRDRVEVHVVAVWGPTIAEVAERVRRAVTPLAYGREVDVFVESLADDRADQRTEPPTEPDQC